MEREQNRKQNQMKKGKKNNKKEMCREKQSEFSVFSFISVWFVYLLFRFHFERCFRHVYVCAYLFERKIKIKTEHLRPVFNVVVRGCRPIEFNHLPSFAPHLLLLLLRVCFLRKFLQCTRFHGHYRQSIEINGFVCAVCLQR